MTCRLKIFSLIFALGLCFGKAAFAAGDEFGIAVGTPSQLSYQHGLGELNAFNVGLSYDSDHFVYVSGDYHWNIQNFGRPFFTPYVGFGAFVASHTRSYDDSKHDYYGVSNPSTVVGARVPFGLEIRPKQVPMTAFIELGPTLTVTPNTAGFFQILIGVRFRF